MRVRLKDIRRNHNHATRQEIAKDLEKVVPGRVVSDATAYSQDWWPLYQISTNENKEQFVGVKPLDADELEKIIRYAAFKSIPLVCRGGGSSVTGSSVPLKGIVIDITGMDKVLDINETNKTMVIQSGAKLDNIEAMLNETGFTLGQIPQSFELATIGGYISTFGTGQFSTLYGGIENSVLRLEVMLPDGRRIWTRTRDVPRSSVGPDLTKLFIGSEGAYGIILSSELKLHRLPEHKWQAAYLFESLDDAIKSVKKLTDMDVQPAVCRVYDDVESNFYFNNAKPTVLLTYHFSSSLVRDTVASEVEKVMTTNGIGTDPSLVDKWLENRFAFRKQIEEMKKIGYMVDTIESASNWTNLLGLYTDTVAGLGNLEGVGAIGAHISHLYQQGACIYFTVLFKPDRELYWNIWNMMGDIVERRDATLSHHHGVGILKSKLVEEETPIELLRRLKRAIDPNSIMNPDKFM